MGLAESAVGVGVGEGRPGEEGGERPVAIICIIIIIELILLSLVFVLSL